MNEETLLKFYVSLYGRCQIEMAAVGLVDKNGVPKSTKGMSETEKDGIKIYDFLSYKVKGLTVEKLHELASYTNELMMKLLNENKYINNYLLGMMQYRLFLQDEASVYEKNLMLPKVERSIKFYKTHVKDDDIVRTTSRVADNIYRLFTDRLQLSDEVRDARAKRFIRLLNG